MGESNVLPSTVLPCWCPSCPVTGARQELRRLRAPLAPWHYMASLELGAGAAFRLNGTAEELQ